MSFQRSKEGKDQDSIQSNITPNVEVKKHTKNITDKKAKRSALSQQEG